MIDSPGAFAQRVIAHLDIQQGKKRIVCKALSGLFFVILNYTESVYVK